MPWLGYGLPPPPSKVQHHEHFYDWDWKRCSNDSILIQKHDYGAVDEGGVMRSCFPAAQT